VQRLREGSQSEGGNMGKDADQLGALGRLQGGGGAG
jgi:hypothetical protein